MASCEVAIAIINYNTRTWLASCLDSILKAPPLVAYEIFLVDNASTDGSVDFVKENYPSVHVIDNAGNLGYSAAANQAIRTSEAKYVLVLNTDTELDPEVIDILVEFGDAHEDMGVAGPKLLNADGTIQISGRQFPSFIDATAHAFLGIIWPANPFSVRYK
ncbi:MAG TPA: glycosyltransferase, partial [Actinobacteria bacterium]|nr:glycosyltransferase [Actinomycetota bacterium]